MVAAQDDKDLHGCCCPLCGYDAGVKDSRPSKGNTIRRRRLCGKCGYRFTTFEIAVPDEGSAASAHNLGVVSAQIGAAVSGLNEALATISAIEQIKKIAEDWN